MVEMGRKQQEQDRLAAHSADAIMFAAEFPRNGEFFVPGKGDIYVVH